MNDLGRRGGCTFGPITFIAGMLFGFILGMSTASLADGYLFNVKVTAAVRQGTKVVTVTVCEDPFYWRSLGLIEC
jgi:hypothetical protein